MSSFKFVPQLGNTATFFDWFNSYNVTARDKMNSILISRPFKGDGITFTGNTADGGYTFSIDDTVNKNIAFNGNVQFNGIVNLSNVELSNILVGITGNFLPFGVTVGSLVRIGDTGGLTLARANNPPSAESIGVAVSVDNTKTTVAVAGKISGTEFTNYLSPGGFSLGCVYFLDPVNAGGITKTEPVLLGTVSKPVLLGVNQNEAIILPYRGQFINDDGISGDANFNSTLYVSVSAVGGETLGDFQLGVGTILAAADKTIDLGDFYDAYPTPSYVFFKANSDTDRKYIIGIVTEILEFTSTSGGKILLKVNTNGSVIPNITTLNSKWATLGSYAGLIYLDENGDPTRSEGALRIGTVIATDFVLDILSPSTSFFNFSGDGNGGVSNLMINGSLSLWQRGRGVSTPYTITTGTTETKQYLADRWVMWAGKTSGFSESRKSFTNVQTEVLGYPKYYVSLIKNSTPSSTPSFFYNVIDDARIIADKPFTLSFYVKTDGPTGEFNVRSIQNISLGGGGNSYINDTIHATFSADLNWERKTVLIEGLPVNSGITSSYSLIGIQLNENGKTFNFAQFVLQPGSQETDPPFVDVDEDYKKAAKYYQRSYLPEELSGTVYSVSGSSTLNIKNAESYQSGPNPKAIFYFPIKMNKSPIMEFYSLSGTTADATVVISGVGRNLKNSSTFIGFGGCARFWIPQLPDPITVDETHQNSYIIKLNSPWCQFDQLFFHYVADADTTIN